LEISASLSRLRITLMLDTAARDSWVVTGEFVEVDTGNRAMQAGVGFGTGQSQLEVYAKVYSGSDMHTLFLTFDSKAQADICRALLR
jgi:uncharacterized protein DUF4410